MPLACAYRAPEAGECCRVGHLARGLQWIEPLLDPVDVLAGPGEAVLLDLRAGAGADHLGDAVRLAEHQAAAADVELVAIEGADRRAGRPVAFLVVLAAVAGAAEAAGRQCRDQGHLTGLRLLLELALLEQRPVRLHKLEE